MTERDTRIEAKAAELLGYTTEQVKRKTMAELKRELREAGGQEKTSKATEKIEKSPKNVSFAPPKAFSEKVPLKNEKVLPRPTKTAQRTSPSPRRRRSRSWSSRTSSSESPSPRGARVHKPSVRRETSHSHHSIRQHRKSHDGGRRSSVVELDEVVKLHQELRAKVKFTEQLRRDTDFSRGDFREWEKSVDRCKKRLDRAMIHSELHIGQEGASSEEKVAELHALWKRREAKIAEMQKMKLLDDELLEVWKRKQSLIQQIYRDLRG